MLCVVHFMNYIQDWLFSNKPGKNKLKKGGKNKNIEF